MLVKQQIYVALTGRMGEYRGHGTIWASGQVDARERLEEILPADHPWKSTSNRRAERSLGNLSRRVIDSNTGEVLEEIVFGEEPSIY